MSTTHTTSADPITIDDVRATMAEFPPAPDHGSWLVLKFEPLPVERVDFTTKLLGDIFNPRHFGIPASMFGDGLT